MTEIKFPSIVGITLQGEMLVHDSKGKVRTLNNFNHKTGRKTYKDKVYTGPIVRNVQFSIPVDQVPTFKEWRAKQERKNK